MYAPVTGRCETRQGGLLRPQLPPSWARRGRPARVLLEGPMNADPVIGMKASGGGRIGRGEPPVEGAAPFLPGHASSEVLSAGSAEAPRRPFEQSADVEAVPPTTAGKLRARADAPDRLEGLEAEARGVVALVGADQVQEMMFSRGPLGGRGLPCRYHLPIDLRESALTISMGRRWPSRTATAVLPRRRPDDHEERRSHHHVRRSSRLIP